MGLWSSICSAASSAWSTVKEVGSGIWNAARETAARAVEWMAEKAEVFVGSVKSVWNRVKPFINKVIRPVIQKAADLAAKTLPNFPWIGSALKALDKALGLLVEWDKSDLAKRISKAIA